MQICISKEPIKCLYLTKETRDKVLRELDLSIWNDSASIIEDNNKWVTVCYNGHYKVYYYYNHWYVRNHDYKWVRYTDEEFNELFQLVEDKNH